MFVGDVADFSSEYPHPQRPRCSQSGREKRRDESFQARAEEPLGTDSHWTISKRIKRMLALDWAQKMICIIVPNRRTVCSCKGNFNSFSTFLTRNEGTTDEWKKRFGCYQQEQFNMH